MKKCILFIFGIVSIINIYNSNIKAQNVSRWDGIDTTAWINGLGTIGMPYLIESAGNLACLAKRVNEGYNYAGVYFKLTTNLNLAGGNWIPIGISTSYSFNGNFDGDYYTIDSLTLTLNPTATSFVGLFGMVQSAVIQKVILSNVNVKQTSASAGIYTGALLGATNLGAKIINCSVLSGVVYSVSNTGSRGYAGGIVGCSQFGLQNLTIQNCNNAAEIYGNYAVGGIVGMLNVTTNDVDTAWINNCHNTGLINGLPSPGNVYTGGVIGWINLQRNYTEIYMDNCYNTAYVKDTTHSGIYAYTGGVIGYLQNTATAINNINASISNVWNNGKVENISTSLDVTTNKWSYAAGIVGNVTLYGVAKIYYSNVYNTGEVSFSRISPKTTSAVSGVIGLLSVQKEGGYISLSQSYNTGKIELISPDTANNLTYAGGIIGWLYSSQGGKYLIDRCFNSGNISNESFYSGGIVGYTYGGSSSGNIIQNCINNGKVQSKNTAGGITACYEQRGTNNYIQHCLSVGTIITPSGPSGIAGTLWDSTILDLATCYYDRQITGCTRGTSPIGAGASKMNDTVRYARQIAELQLDPSVWYMETGMYPRLLCFQHLDEMILAATPIFFYADTAANIYNSVYEVNRSFNMGGKTGTFFHSSKPASLAILNNDSAVLHTSSIDTVILTVNYGTAGKTIDLILKPKPFINIEDTITYCSNELPILYRNLFIDKAGDYTFTSNLSNAYDTNFTIHAIVNQAYDTVLMIEISESEIPFVFGEHSLTKAGVYKDTFQTVYSNCDSIVCLVLMIRPIDEAVPICLVSVDTNNRNIVIWEKPDVNYISTFKIYREANDADNYVLIKTLPYDSLATYVDVTSNASQKAYRYKLGAMTIYGYETNLSPYHQTIHLTINKGIGNKWNLIWTPYEGLEYTSYSIYRGTSKSNMQKITDISANFTSYTDEVVGTVYYQIEINLPYSCNPQGIMSLKSGDDNRYYSTKSNIVCNDETTIVDAVNNIEVKIWPNPAKDYVDILWEENAMVNQVLVLDMYGKTIYSQQVNDRNARLDISSLANGMYVIQLKNNHQVLGNYKFICDK